MNNHKITQEAEALAKNAIKKIRNEQRGFRAILNDVSFINISGKAKDIFGEYEKDSNDKPVCKKEGEITMFFSILSETRHEFEEWAHQQIKTEIAKLDTDAISSSGVKSAGGLGVASGVGASILTTSAPLFGIGFLGNIGLTTSVAMFSPIAATGIGAAVGAVLFGSIMYFKSNKIREESIVYLDELSDKCVKNIDKMKFEAIKELNKRMEKINALKDGNAFEIKGVL